jgi:very-short-patch-repair endonuclease
MIARARQLRRDMTGPERKLWDKLRAHRLLGLHFRRQVPVSPYVADFHCHAARVVIEVDGDQHGFPDRVSADKRRDEFLSGQGLRVLRFSNWQVMNEFESVLLTIESAVGTFAPSQPSPEGEG